MPMQAQRESEGIAPTTSKLQDGIGWSVPPSGKIPADNCTEGRVCLGTVIDGTKNFAPTRIRSPERPNRSESLYRLRYSSRQFGIWIIYMNVE